MKKKQKQEQLHAIDVVNWDYLCGLSENFDPNALEEELCHRKITFEDGLRVFAYDFTSTANEDIRDRMLRDVLRNATQSHSSESASLVISTFAKALNSEVALFMEFAKQCGIKLPRQTTDDPC